MSNRFTGNRKGIRFFNEMTEEKKVVYSIKRGRSSDLIQKRNECLVLRYYFHSKIRRLKYEDVLSVLSEEFFLSEYTIVKIVSLIPDIAREAFRAEITVTELQKRYQFLKWNN